MLDQRKLYFVGKLYFKLIIVLSFFLFPGQLEARSLKIKLSDITLPDDTLTAYNIFTPNEDGINDVFNFNTGSATVIKGIIFNRWGLKVLEWESQQSWWDGRGSNGVLLPEGTYFYTIEAKYTGRTIPSKGFVYLIR